MKFPLWLIVVWLVTSATHAQDDLFTGIDPGGWHHLDPNMTPEALAEALDTLPNLTSDQRVIIETLHEGYIEQFRETSFPLRQWLTEKLHERRQENDGRSYYEPRELTAWSGEWDPTLQLEWRRARAEIERQFGADVAPVLNGAQRAVWESITRRQRRTIELPPGRGTGWPGEFDLVRVIDALDLPPEEMERIRPIMFTYEIAIDSIVLERETIGIDHQLEGYALRLVNPEIRRLGTNATGAGVERAREMAEWLNEQRMGFVRLNYDTHDRLIAALPHHRHEQFREEFGRLMYPDVYVATPAELLLRSFQDESDLPARCRKAIESIRVRYFAQRQPIYHQLTNRARRMQFQGWDEEEIAQFEADRAAYDEAVHQNPGEFIVMPAPWVEPWRKRFLLNQRTCREIRALLSDEEFRGLPAHVRLLLSWQGP